MATRGGWLQGGGMAPRRWDGSKEVGWLQGGGRLHGVDGFTGWVGSTGAERVHGVSQSGPWGGMG